MEFEPALVIFSGPPFTGKTTLSKELASRSNFIHYDSDPFRLEVVGHDQSLPDDQEAEAMVESYRRMHAAGLAGIRRGKPVSLAATYWRPVYKPLFAELLAQITVLVKTFELRVNDSEIESRASKRQLEGDPSDIKTLEQYLPLKKGFDPIVFVPRHIIDTTQPLSVCFEEILTVLKDLRIS